MSKSIKFPVARKFSIYHLTLILIIAGAVADFAKRPVRGSPEIESTVSGALWRIF